MLGCVVPMGNLLCYFVLFSPKLMTYFNLLYIVLFQRFFEDKKSLFKMCGLSETVPTPETFPDMCPVCFSELSQSSSHWLWCQHVCCKVSINQTLGTFILMLSLKTDHKYRHVHHEVLQIAFVLA